MTSLSRFAIAEFGRESFGGRFLAPLSRLPQVPRQEHGAGQFWASAEGLAFLMDSFTVLRHQSVSPFIPTDRDYSGSAAALDEEAAKAAFSSPSRSPPFHQWLMGGIYRTFGRRRASPVTSQDHFLQAAARITPLVPFPAIRMAGRKASIRYSSVLRSRAVSGTPLRPKCRLPESPCLAPSSSHLLPDLPVMERWLLTSANVRSASKVFCTGTDPHR